MNDIQNIKNVYFLGIGGIGMSALARYFKFTGRNVAGYDRTQTALTDTLQDEGIDVHFKQEERKKFVDFFREVAKTENDT